MSKCTPHNSYPSFPRSPRNISPYKRIVPAHVKMSPGRLDNILDCIGQKGYYFRRDEGAGAQVKEFVGLKEWDWVKGLTVCNSSIDDVPSPVCFRRPGKLITFRIP